MSEYQHYEFHAIDKPLNAKGLEAVSKMSSRVQLSPRKAIFTYSYGDFRYNAEEVLTDYFDFMLYIANWGTKRIMMKFPTELVDYEFLKKYRISVLSGYEQDIRIVKKAEYVILDINFSEEDGLGWIDEGDYGYDFLNIRSEIMNGDYRSLFIIWLRFLEDLYDSDDFEDDYSFESGLIPSNLRHLSPSGDAAKAFYEVNQDWLDVMHAYSNNSTEKLIDYEAEVRKMSKDAMVAYMQMILRDESNIKVRLLKELNGGNMDRAGKVSYIKLLEVAEKATEIKQSRLEQEQKRKAREKLERLNHIQQNKKTVEREIIGHIEQGNSKHYKEAVSRLVELKEMHKHFNTEAHFEVFVNQIKSQYSRKSSLISMLKEKKWI